MTIRNGNRLIVLMIILSLGCRSGDDELTEKWTVIDTGIGSFFLNHEDVFFTGSETGWVTGRGYVLHTSNGGKTWYYQVNDTAGIYKGFFRSLFFTDEDHGWVCGDLGTFLRTTNGGTSWQLVPMPEYNLSSVFFIDASTGWLSSFAGQVYKTTDGGINWWLHDSIPGVGIVSLYFKNSDEGWFSSYGFPTGGAVFRTTDGGDSWELQKAVSQSLNNISFFNEIGWVGAEDGVILGSTDRGLTWFETQSPTVCSIYTIAFFNESVGWAASNCGAVMKSTDRGATWLEIPQPVPGFVGWKSFRFATKSEAWLVGNYFILNLKIK